ncbi:MAG TPA: hypothetical protein VGM23_13195 [Armatimonadota bacterium]|jgi:hypothetical protein
MNNPWQRKLALALACLAVGGGVQAALVVKTDGTSLNGALAPRQALTLVCGRHARTLPVHSITWLAGEKTRRLRLSQTTGPLLTGTIPTGALTLRVGTKAVKVPLSAVAFLYTGAVQQGVNVLEVYDYQQVHGATLKDVSEVRQLRRGSDKRLGVYLFVSNWQAGARITNVRYPDAVADAGTLPFACTVTTAHDAFANLAKTPVVGVLVAHLPAGGEAGKLFAYAGSFTPALPSAADTPVATTLTFTAPLRGAQQGKTSVFLYLKEDVRGAGKEVEIFANGMVEAEKTVSNILCCPVTVQ